MTDAELHALAKQWKPKGPFAPTYASAISDPWVGAALLAEWILRLEAELAQAQAQLQWIGECIEGLDVSEFAESFPLVRAVKDLKAELGVYKTLLYPFGPLQRIGDDPI